MTKQQTTPTVFRPITESGPAFAKKFSSKPASPIGSMGFKLKSNELFDAAAKGGIIFEGASGAHTIRIEREKDLAVTYYYWSPGTGCRRARVNLAEVQKHPVVRIMLNWSPEKIQLAIQPDIPNASAVCVEGQASNKSFRAARDGRIAQVGDDFVQAMGMEIYINGKPLMIPTAMEMWDETQHATKALLTGTSADGYLYDVAVSNAVLSGLVTGFATYCKRRLVEIEWEGIAPDLERLRRVVEPNSKRRKTILEDSTPRAGDAGLTVLAFWIEEEDRINFQNLEICERAFRRGYGVDFSGSNAFVQLLDRIKQYLIYRHRIQHVSPLLTIYDRNAKPPVLPSKEFAEVAISDFCEFVQEIHKRTLALRPRTAPP